MSLNAPKRWWASLRPSSQIELLREREPLLAAFSFLSRGSAPELVGTGLQSLNPAVETWRAFGKLRAGQIGAARFVADDDTMLTELRINEADCGGLRRAARDAYQRLIDYTASSAYPHVLKVWSHFSAINNGVGDDERYKQFCIGRAAGLGTHWRELEPAATVIGRKEYDPDLHLVWLSSVRRGEPVDNPRQTLPRAYPRLYGPEPPRFSRAMLMRGFFGDALILSGTASVVGAETAHRGQFSLQFAEAKRNLDVLLAEGAHRLGAAAQWGEGTMLRVYVRHDEDLVRAQSLLSHHFPASVQAVVLSGDICRDDLLVEIDGIQQW